MDLYVDDYEQLKMVENFLFRFTYPKEFSLRIIIRESDKLNEYYYYKTVYNKFAKALVLETF